MAPLGQCCLFAHKEYIRVSSKYPDLFLRPLTFKEVAANLLESKHRFHPSFQLYTTLRGNAPYIATEQSSKVIHPKYQEHKLCSLISRTFCTHGVSIINMKNAFTKQKV